MNKLTILLVEIGMSMGIIAAAFTVPRSTPLLTFLIVSGAVFALGNLLLIKTQRQSYSKESPSELQRKPNLYPIFILFALYWLAWFIARKI
jgi:hypothetical protein